MSKSAGFLENVGLSKDDGSSVSSRDLRLMCTHLVSVAGKLATSRSRKPHCIIVKRGERGVLVCSAGSGDRAPVEFVEIAPPKVAQIVNTNGAGDTLVGGTVWYLWNHFFNARRGGAATDSAPKALPPASVVEQAVRWGMSAAKLTLESASAISPKIHQQGVGEVFERMLRQ